MPVRSGHLLGLLKPFAKELRQVIEQTGLPAPKAVIKATQKYGCGFFGCVYATDNPSIIFKITTDASEAALVRIIKHLNTEGRFEFPGLAEYYGVWVVPAYDSKGRQVFCLWREEADAIGFEQIVDKYCSSRGMTGQKAGNWSEDYFCRDDDGFMDSHSREVFHDLVNYLSNIKKAGQLVRSRVMRRQRYTDADLTWAKETAKQIMIPQLLDQDQSARPLTLIHALEAAINRSHNWEIPYRDNMALHLAGYWYLSLRLGDIPLGSVLSECFLSLYEANIVLGDVHSDNLGLIGLKGMADTYRISDRDIRITDPGLFTPITHVYDDLPVDILCGDNSQIGLFRTIPIPENLEELPAPRTVRPLITEQWQTMGI